MATPWLDVISYGKTLSRDGTDDWSDAIQKALNDLIALFYRYDTGKPAVSVGVLYLPAGIYRLTKPLLLKYQIPGRAERPAGCLPEVGEPPDDQRRPFGFFHVEMMGDSPGTPGTQTGESHGTILRADYNDLPAIIIQGARSLRLRNLIIEGSNLWAFQSGRNPRDMKVLADDKNFIYSPMGTALNPRARNAPYAGICIDPFSRYVLPMDRYKRPGLLVDGWDLDSYYDKTYIIGSLCDKQIATSSNIWIDGCTIRGFVVGIAIAPTGLPTLDLSLQPANAENIHITKTTIESNVSAIAICQSQSRHIYLQDLTIYGGKYAINCVDYGTGQGNMPSILGAKIAGVKHILNVASFGSGHVIQGIHAEDILSLGQLFGSSDHDGYVFDGCHFRFGKASSDLPVVNAQLINWTHTIFQGCTFERKPGDYDLIVFNNIWTLTFLGCRFHSDRSATPIWITGLPWQTTFRQCMLSGTTDRGEMRMMPFSARQTTTKPDLVWPGSLHQVPGNWDKDGAAPGTLRWVSGIFPMIDLRNAMIVVIGPDQAKVVVDRVAGDPLYDNLGVLPNTGVLLPGDLLLSSREFDDIGFEQSNGLRVGGRVVLGVVEKIEEPIAGSKKEVFLRRIPEVLKQADGQTIPVWASYLPKIHPSTQGQITGSKVDVLSTEGVPLGTAWQVGDRITTDLNLMNSEILYLGTYITRIEGGTLHLSTTATTDLNARVFDADSRLVELLPDP